MIPLFIPYVNRPDLIEMAINNAMGQGADVRVIDNSGAYNFFGWVEVHRPPVPLTFTQTQNWLLKMAEYEQCPFYLFMHADAEAGLGTVTKLINMAHGLTRDRRKWGLIFTAYDALAAFNTKAFLEVGGWDTEFPWYLADCSVYRKLRLAGYELIESNLPVKHEPSQTLKADPRIRRYVEVMTPAWRAWYREMWGGDNEHERYETPFNEGKSKIIV